MKTGKSIMWGLVFVIAGVLLGLSALDIIDIDIFFKGWWTLFLIVPGFIGVFADDNKVGSLVLMLVGILLLLACQGIISFSILGKLILPIIILTIGLSLLFSNLVNKNIRKAINNVNTKVEGEYTAVFSGQDVIIEKEEFKGTTVNAIFGGAKIDLRKAIIKEDVVINAKAVFGGIDFIMPDNVNVKVKSNSVFGGIDNKVTNDNKKVTIYVDATCVFGGIDIK